MQITLADLPFRVHSPSMFEYMHSQGDDRVLIRYTGEKWAIEYHYANGAVARRLFNSRHAAVELIASRAP